MFATVHLAVFDGLADPEPAHALAALHDPRYHRTPGRLRVRTAGLTRDPVTTMGGVRIQPDVVLADLEPSASAMLLLPGGDTWDDGTLDPFTDAARRWLAAGVPVAALCGATGALARAGLLDDRPHTSNAASYLQATGYAGAAHYVEAPAVTDGDLITASGVHPVAFAHEVLRRLDVMEPAALDAWTALHTTGDPAAFFALMEATAA